MASVAQVAPYWCQLRPRNLDCNDGTAADAPVDNTKVAFAHNVLDVVLSTVTSARPRTKRLAASSTASNAG